MILKTSKKADYNLSENDTTSESAWLSRRGFIRSMAASASVLAVPAEAGILSDLFGSSDDEKSANLIPLKFTKNEKLSTNETLTSEYNVTHYNNFYEFGLEKDTPVRLAKDFNTSPWDIQVEGLANKTGTFNLEDLLKKLPLEERIYRMRCVEAWSMVIPWVGFQLSELLKLFAPKTDAKYVEFTTLHDPSRMPGQKKGFLGFSSLKWPYVEGLRMDEAMNPLSFIATGVYGKQLPPQNGAPLRLVVPWKYGFKGIKSIVKIRFVDKQPDNSWCRNAPREYGFYANVNPSVDHPRWSQARERRIVDSSLFSVKRINTLPFNGYAEHVAELYKGMDLRTNF